MSYVGDHSYNFYQICRLCEKSVLKTELVRTCLCPEEFSQVHVKCLEDWIEESGYKACLVCKYPYNIEYVKRYGLFKGLRVYMEATALTVFLSLLVLFITLGLTIPAMYYLCLYIDSTLKDSSVTPYWQYGLFVLLYCGFILAFFSALIALIAVIIEPIYSWYKWWRTTRKVRFGISPEFKF